MTVDDAAGQRSEITLVFVFLPAPTAPPPPPPVEICGNGLDDDGDGLVDEGCAPPPPPPAEVCGDGIDNNGDGLIDENCPLPPAPVAPAPADTTGPVVTIKNVRQNPNSYKFRLEAMDPSGIGSVRVWLNGVLSHAGAVVPVDIDLAIRSLPRGAYPIEVSVKDNAGNTTTVSLTVTK
jgi:hypothetical protein